MRINTNLIAMNTFNQYTKNNNTISKSVEKLSSGYAINSAADNAAGLAISEKMRSQIRGLDQASTNSQDAISLTQTAEGSLSESTEILQRMRELSVQSSNDTNQNAVDREALQDEFSQLQSELNDISSNTAFNKKNLLDGSLASSTATLSNVDLKNSGLSVELGNVAAGSYAFSVGVKQESAAITGKQSTFTADSSSDSFTVGVDSNADGAIENAGEVTNNIAASSLANGNYTITAAYDTTNSQMTFTATGDNGQTFKATLSSTQLYDSFGSGKAAKLDFINGDSTAFSFSVKAASPYDTTSGTTMTTLAGDLSKALSLSASGGVDAQDATYGLYGSMTGADDVKLSAGMNSVTFSNGVKVNFDELTTSDVKTANGATMTTAAEGEKVDAGASGKAGYQIKYSDFKASDDADITAGDLTISAGADPNNANNFLLTATNGTTTYKASISKTALNTAAFTKDDTVASPAALNDIQFTADDGSSFTLDITNTVVQATDHATGGTLAVTLAAGDFLADTATNANSQTGILTASSYKADDTFGATSSTFDVSSVAGKGLTFQVGANSGDELTIHIDKMDSTYLGVASLDISTQDGASSAITAVDKALNTVSSQRAYLGAIENRLDHKIANLNTSSENLTSAESEIRDVDMASEMTKFTNANILSQAATAMLAQANSLPQNVLSLLK